MVVLPSAFCLLPSAFQHYLNFAFEQTRDF
jgi:hypothetical protein